MVLWKKKSTLSVLGISKVNLVHHFSFLASIKYFILFLKDVASVFPNFEEESEFWMKTMSG